MKKNNIVRIMIYLLWGLIFLTLAACGGSEPELAATEAEKPATTEAPAEEQPATKEPNDLLVLSYLYLPIIHRETETPADTLPDLVLPNSDAQEIEQSAEDNGFEFVPLAREHTVIYALPEKGAVFLLTPTAEFPNISASELAQDPNQIERRMLGGLTVVEELLDQQVLPPEHYLITLEGEEIIFFSDSSLDEFRFPAIIRVLPQEIPRPVALITAKQMCLSWQQTQICALINTPLPADLLEKMRGSIANLQNAGILQAGEEAFNLDFAIPDMEGWQVLEQCAEGLSQQEPVYAECRATVLAAPAVGDGAFVPQSEEGETTALGLLIVLEDIPEEVFFDPQLQEAADILPAGDFLSFEVRFPDDEPRANYEGIFETRVRLVGIPQFEPEQDFYLPAMSGGVIIGDPLLGQGPSNDEEAIIVNLWFRGTCFFKKWQCDKIMP